MLASLFSTRNVPDLIAMYFVVLVQSAVVWAILRNPAARASRPVWWGIMAAWAISVCGITIGFLLRFGRIARHFPKWGPGWGRGAAFLWAFSGTMLLLAAYGLGLLLSRLLARPDAGHSPARRRFLGAVRWALLGAPVVATGYGTFVQRFRLSVREQNIPVPDLPRDLEGLRLAQLTDIHLSPFLSVRELQQAVDMANETRPHLALVTGDLQSTTYIRILWTIASMRWRASKPMPASSAAWGIMRSTQIRKPTPSGKARGGACASFASNPRCCVSGRLK